MPLIATINKFLSNHDADIYIWHLTEKVTELLELLPDKGLFYIKQLDQFSSIKRQKEWLSIRVILHLVLGKDARISYTSFGKPFINIDNVHISISHTKSYAAIAFSTTPIGIDIEKWTDRAFCLNQSFLMKMR